MASSTPVLTASNISNVPTTAPAGSAWNSSFPSDSCLTFAQYFWNAVYPAVPASQALWTRHLADAWALTTAGNPMTAVPAAAAAVMKRRREAMS